MKVFCQIALLSILFLSFINMLIKDVKEPNEDNRVMGIFASVIIIVIWFLLCLGAGAFSEFFH